MGKFTGSLEKAGYDVGLEGLTEAPSPRVGETYQEGEQRTQKESFTPPSTPPRQSSGKIPQENAPQPTRVMTSRERSHRPLKDQPKTIHGRPGVWDERLFKAVNDDLYLPEIFKIIRSRILNPGEEVQPPRTIMVTSVIPREGKSFITANLGISIARGLDQHCLMIDCDLRRPSLAGLFGGKQGPGLADYLREEGTALPELIVKTEVNKLSILASGVPPVNPAELLSSERMKGLIEELSTRYDDRIILFDTPPMLIAAESSLLASQVDTVLLVVGQGKASRSQVHKLIEAIGPQRILGVVFNDYRVSPFESNLAKGYGYYQGGYS